MFKYISFVLMQTCWIVLSAYISGLVNLIFLILGIPFTNHKFISKILTFINVFFQNYITISILMTNAILIYFYNSSLNQNINLIALIILSFLLYLLSIQTSAATKYKNENDYEIKSEIGKNLLLSIIFSVLLFILMSLSKNLIWTAPGELIYEFISWIQGIRVIGSVFNFAINTISFLCLINWIWQLLIIIIASIAALVNKIKKRKEPDYIITKLKIYNVQNNTYREISQRIDSKKFPKSTYSDGEYYYAFEKENPDDTRLHIYKPLEWYQKIESLRKTTNK